MLHRLHGAKSLTGFKLCATTPNNMQQGVQTDPTCNIQQCWVRLHGVSETSPLGSGLVTLNLVPRSHSVSHFPLAVGDLGTRLGHSLFALSARA